MSLNPSDLNRIILKEAKPTGPGAHIMVPKDWIGKKIICVPEDEISIIELKEK